MALFSIKLWRNFQLVSTVKERNWKGTILWRAASNPCRPGYSRKNWFVEVEFIEPIEQPEIRDKDIVYETMRSGGYGGQNVNKLETTVRATHKHTGISVKCSVHRIHLPNVIIVFRDLLRLYKLIHPSTHW